MAGLYARENTQQLSPHSEQLLQLVQLFVQSFNLGHVSDLEEFLELQLCQVCLFTLWNQFLEQNLCSGLDLLRDHILVGYRYLNFVNSLDLRLAESPIGVVSEFEVSVVVFENVLLKDQAGAPVHF